MNKFALVVMSLVPAVALAQAPAAGKAAPAAKGPAPQAAQPAKDNAAAKTPAAPAAKDAKAPAMATPPAPPEVKQTVDAFKGNWKFDATMSATGMPGMEKPAAIKGMTFNCKEVAGKTAVSCDAKAKSPMGPMEALFVIAYDPYTKAVHYFGFTNDNEVHDHVCHWKSDTEMTCDPLKGGMGPGGDEVTEDLSMTWDAKKKEVSFKSVSKMTKGGAVLTFEGKGKR